ncbi:hypothetical protein CABS01_10007, partial [Colletotrichum abscissum]|uniref:uncharacterized protein n=1 Tax=Colletotrichum abscissum TaxID=1671311 RepID=UPI0027D570D4
DRGFLARFQRRQESGTASATWKDPHPRRQPPPRSPSLLAYCTPLQSPLQHSRIDKSQHHFTSQAQSNDHPSQRGLRYTSLPTPDHATVYVTTDTNLVRSQIPPCPGSRLVWSHLARRRLLPLPRRIRRFCCDVLLLRRPFFLSNPKSPGFSPPSTDVMGCESTSCPGCRRYTHSHGSNNGSIEHTRHGPVK